ncbi:MAG TPA: CU044_5270 family protein, partial [Streptosporangiaceae bacterium]
MDELTRLADLRGDVPADLPFPAAHRALLAEIAGARAGAGPAVAPRRRFLRPSVVVSGLATGAVAAGAIVAAVTGTEPGSGTGRHAPVPVPATGSLAPLRLAAVTDPMALAHNAAELARRAPVPAPTQWVYVKKDMTISHDAPSGAMRQVPGSHHIVETWTRVDMQYMAHLRGGATVVISTHGGFGTPIGWPAISYPYLNSLPTDPAALLATIRRNIIATYAYRAIGGSGDDQVFEAIHALIENYPVLPARLNAALYGVLARLDGVRLGHRVDNAGRRMLSLDHVEDGLRTSLLINPVTYAYAGQQAVQVRDHSVTGLDGTRHFRKGEIYDDEAVLVSKIV